MCWKIDVDLREEEARVRMEQMDRQTWMSTMANGYPFFFFFSFGPESVKMGFFPFHLVMLNVAASWAGTRPLWWCCQGTIRGRSWDFGMIIWTIPLL